MELTQSYLKSILHYDPETGLFTRKKTTAHHAKKGDVVGNLHSHGYLRVNIGGKLYFLHRLAFLYMTGSFPESITDHLNGIRSDNRWENLRAASYSDNCKNTRLRRTNTSGVNGVHWAPKKQHWVVQFKSNNGQRKTKTFNDLDAAIAYRKEGEIERGFHADHGTSVRPVYKHQRDKYRHLHSTDVTGAHDAAAQFAETDAGSKL